MKYDALIVGGGITGVLIANDLASHGKKVLILEAGDATSLTREGYRSYVDYYLANAIKTPNSAYPDNPNAPSPEATSIVDVSERPSLADGYFVQMGPNPFSSNYNRNLGGTTLHWMGTCYRLCPHDFEIKTLYDRGHDWPIGYDDLEKFYSLAEYEIGVSADVCEQRYLGIEFRKGYVFPMLPLPHSYFDRMLIDAVDGMTIEWDGEQHELKVITIPVGRNSIPNADYRHPRQLYGHGKSRQETGYTPVGAVGAPELGQRCEGNSSCTPICPVQAKYSALKTLEKAKRNGVEVLTQTVASRILFDEDHRQVTGICCKQYPGGPGEPFTQKTYHADTYVIAAHAVENAKLMLASNAVDESKQLGRNLMDHPYLLTWGQAPQPIGAFRGPGYTSGIPTLSDGAFRKNRAAFRVDIGNWGWNFSTFAPDSTVAGLLAGNTIGAALRRGMYDECQGQVRFGFMVEQLPSAKNYVCIDDRFLDAIGNHRPVIHYEIDDYTVGGFDAAVELTKSIFKKMKIADKTAYHSSEPGYVKGYSYHGSGHIVGTHRMGKDKDDGVVNSYQQSWQYSNLYVAGCGSMPTIATSNPTLTCAALALRTARHIRKGAE